MWPRAVRRYGRAVRAVYPFASGQEPGKVRSRKTSHAEGSEADAKPAEKKMRRPYPGLRGIFSVLLAGILSAQVSAPHFEFEAASIKLNVDGTPYVFNGMKSPGTYSAENQTLRSLIQEAYGIPGGRRSWLPYYSAAGMGMPILGGPKWIGSDRYDVAAKWTPTLQSME